MVSTPTPPRLIIVSDMGHIYYELGDSGCVLGRAPDNDVVLKGNLISRRHACVESSGDQWVLRDLNSHNGTYLNGERVTTERSLTNWDAARMGRTLVFFVDPQTFASESSSSAQLPSAVDVDNPTASSGAQERIRQQLSQSLDPAEIHDLLASFQREERQSVLDQVLGKIRRESIPATLPLMERHHFTSHRISAVEGGGDFVAVVMQGSFLVVAVGNVRGWGMTATLNAAIARSTVQSVLEIAKAPADVLAGHCQKALERTLPKDTVFNVLITRFADTGEVQASCYGSCSALLFRRFNPHLEVLRNAEDAAPGSVIGFSAKLSQGDGLVLTTEGTTLSRSSSGDVFSLRQLRSAARDETQPGTEALLEALTESYSQFTDRGQKHDATFVVVAFGAE